MKSKRAADAAWKMFAATGDPAYYSLYVKFKEEEN